MPPPGIAPGLPAPQAGVLLLYYSGWRVEDPGIDPGSQPCEGCMLPCTTIPQMCVHRDSNPNLNLGRVEYYPCTMNAYYCRRQMRGNILRLQEFIRHKGELKGEDKKTRYQETSHHHASIAQLAEHALSKRKVTSSILVGGFVGPLV